MPWGFGKLFVASLKAVMSDKTEERDKKVNILFPLSALSVSADN